jgi:hypothetical protein
MRLPFLFTPVAFAFLLFVLVLPTRASDPSIDAEAQAAVAVAQAQLALQGNKGCLCPLGGHCDCGPTCSCKGCVVHHPDLSKLVWAEVWQMYYDAPGNRYFDPETHQWHAAKDPPPTYKTYLPAQFAYQQVHATPSFSGSGFGGSNGGACASGK